MLSTVLARLLPVFSAAVQTYLRGGSPATFERAMQQALARAHTAAYLRGLAERSAGGRVREWLARLVGDRALPATERAVLRAALAEQFGHLSRFVSQLDTQSDAQVAARVGMYAASAKSSYWRAWAGAEMECYPGSCPECYSRCRCALDRRDDGVYWTGPGDAHSCGACRGRIGKRMGK